MYIDEAITWQEKLIRHRSLSQSASHTIKIVSGVWFDTGYVGIYDYLKLYPETDNKFLIIF